MTFHLFKFILFGTDVYMYSFSLNKFIHFYIQVGVYIGSTKGSGEQVPHDLYPNDALKTSGCKYTVSQYSSFSLARWSGITNTALNEVSSKVSTLVTLQISNM